MDKRFISASGKEISKTEWDAENTKYRNEQALRLLVAIMEAAENDDKHTLSDCADDLAELASTEGLNIDRVALARYALTGKTDR